MNRQFSLAFSLPLAASIAGHGFIVVLLILLVGRVAPIVLPPQPKPAIEIMLAPPEPPPPAAAIEPPPPEPPPPVVETVPPPPEPPPPVVKVEPPPVAVATPPPPRPRPKPVAKRPPQRVRELPPEPMPVPYRAITPPVPPQPPPVQTATVPRPVPPPAPPAPIVSANYRAMLSAWLESHKRYPDSARARGEEGRAVLRFHVHRSGQVLNYAVIQSTGYPDLDAAIDQMMRGASLPPFPADMTATDVEVSVPIRFALAR